MIGMPSPEEMEAVRIDALSQKVLAGLTQEELDNAYAVRVSRKGQIQLLTKEEYEELWQNK